MKGLAVTILLAILELGAIATSDNALLTDGPAQVLPIRKEEEGIQAEVLVEAERPDIADGNQVSFSKNAKGRSA